MTTVSRKHIFPHENRSAWRTPTISATVHNLPFGLKSFAKPDRVTTNIYEVLMYLYLSSSLDRYKFLPPLGRFTGKPPTKEFKIHKYLL